MRIVFMGTPEAAVPTLRSCLEDGHEIVAVWTQPDRPAGRGKKISFSPVKDFALSQGLTVHQPSRLKTDEARLLFASHEADVAVVVAYGRINVHFSLLPLYRGAAPVNWAMVNGEEETGVTTMFLEQVLDSGPILMQRKTAIGAKETAPQLMKRLAEMGAELLGETLAQLDVITPRPQHYRDATFAPLLKKEDGLINWSNSAFAIERCVRGFQPWPNAHTSFKSRGLIIWSSEPILLSDDNAQPGEVIHAHGDELIVKCGEHTALRLVEVQPEAKRRIPARDFLNGVHLKVGDRFGET